MKMPTLPKMKMPKLPKLPKPQPKRLQATARRAAQPSVEDYDEEPTTRLSSAFVVVLILHIVAVGGIYAFNSIKAHRRGQDAAPTPATSANTPAAVAAAPAKAAAPVNDSVAAAAPADQAPAPSRAVEAPVTAAVVPPPAPVTPVSPISGNRIHRVRSGDTLSRVASLYNVTVSDIEEFNGLKPGAVLRPNQALNIPSSRAEARTPMETRKSEVAANKKAEPAKTETAKAATPAKAAASATSSSKTYTVKKGENPVSIAKKLGVSYDELLKLNKITDPKKLRVDQVLKVPAKKGE